MLDSDEEDEPKDERKEIEHELFKDDDEIVSCFHIYVMFILYIFKFW